MTKAEMIKRLRLIPESARVGMYQEARAGNSAYAVAGYDRAGLKAANAVCQWRDSHGRVPTDAAIADVENWLELTQRKACPFTDSPSTTREHGEAACLR